MMPHSAASIFSQPQEILMSAFNYIWENKEVYDV